MSNHNHAKRLLSCDSIQNFSNLCFYLPTSTYTANLPPQLVGPSSFLLNAGELSVYTFNASDDGGEQVQVNILGGLPANATLLQVNSTTYNFTWRLTNPNHASNLTFYASDSFGVVGVLSPEIVVCACQNGGNCTSEGMLSAQNNVLIMNCICPSGM